MAEVLVRGPGVEQRIPLQGGTVSVGRERFNDIVVPDAKASRKHAQVEKIGEDQWMITDLGSSNGTFLRGERISQVLIHENDVFTIGAVSMIFTGVEASVTDDRMPTTMASAEELNAKMAVMQARREREAQVPTAPTPPVASPPPPPVAVPVAMQGMETMDLRAMPAGQAPAAPPAPLPPIQEFATDRTVDLAAMHASNRPPASPPMTQPPPGKPAQKQTDPEELDEHQGTVAIMADQAKAGVSMFNAAPAPTGGGLSNPFATGGASPPPVPARPPAPSGLPPMSSPPAVAMVSSGAAMPIEPFMLFLMRFAARFIDAIVMFPVMIVIGIGFAILNVILIKIAPPLLFVSMAVQYLIIFSLQIAYEVYFVSKTGQTYGKRWLGLKIVADPGYSILTSGGVIKRMLCYLVAALPCGLGLLLAAIDKEGKGLHDKMAGTRVLKVSEPNFDGFSLPK